MLSFNQTKDLKRSFLQHVKEKFSTVDQQEVANPTQCLQTHCDTWDTHHLVAYYYDIPQKSYENLYLKVKNSTQKYGRVLSGRKERCNG